MIRGIVFDLFDTLVDQNHRRLAPIEVDGRRMAATVPELHAFARSHAGIDHDLAGFVALLETVDAELRRDTLDVGVELSTVDRFRALAARLGCADPDAVAAGLTRVHMGALRDAVSVPDHHEPVLIALARGYRLGLCSNFSDAGTARAVLGDAGFVPHLRSIVISEEVGIRKPRPEIFEAAAAGLDLEPREILHVGDSLSADVAGASAFGMKTVWLTRRIREPEAELARHRGPRPDFALDDLRDLPVLMARFGAGPG
ncbi:MAG: HAD family hydrolase [Deltaproteobacteria bacterium]|nr:HAD family hydrolase [Deltaproteobacteria bacterium]